MEKKVLVKYDASMNAVPTPATLVMEAPEDLPDGGVAGNVLKKTADGLEWAAEIDEVPAITAEDVDGSVLKVRGGAAIWSPETVELPEITELIDVGFVLKVTAEGVEWAAETTELPAIGEDINKFLTVNALGVLVWADIPQVMPTLPLVDGEYKLVITEGVASWAAIV